ncbi:hypothetical protein IL992_44095 [Microbispora sp. NEAU-D428]|uniref:papain-like cysteine protease family protein n=1 Tax=Microbispora sitophila TaxID=2771537 RepID=UPI001867AFAE|nr:papain-like cysteine protease family protein [Microbispora sitophila]MBE3016083.1 hypothetical protein [Microbispora sitophila]
MIVLQRGISYAGEAGENAVVQVLVQVPRLVLRIDSDGTVSGRFSGDTVDVSFTQPADRDVYRIDLPDELVSRPAGESAQNAARFVTAAVAAGNIDALTVPVLVRHLTEDGQPLGEQNLDVLVLPALALGDSRQPLTHVVASPEPPTRAVAVADAPPKYFIVAKKPFLDLRARLRGLETDAMALAVVCYVTHVAPDGVPVYSETAAARLSAQLAAFTSAEVAEQTVTALAAGHPGLVDVPLTIPEIRAMKVAGTLTVLAPDSVIVTAKDFAAFDLGAEWTDANGLSRSRHFRFGDQIKVTKRSAGFVLTEGRAVLRSTVHGRLRVSVQGLAGATLWSEEFDRDDPTLADLRITVPRQTATELTTPQTPPVDANLRLRGRVILINRTCATKDVLVVIKARTTAEGPWRLVGAASIDTGGNFGMPYPYGAFVEAQAVCTAAPDEPADIPIVADAANRTISTDFLYLMVRNARLPNQDGEDCGCGCGSGTSNRLPDFADLIGSDTYTQDIGGSCVNLSKPNRTINEFPYQALVRISDPDVASYRLIRQETGLQAIDVSEAAALTAEAARLQNRSEVALAAARQALGETHAAWAGRSLAALEAAHPHAVAVAAAFAAGGPPITVSVLAEARNHLEAVVAVLDATRTQLGADDLPFPPQAVEVLDAAAGTIPLVTQAIDTVGTSVHYDLVGDTTTRPRLPVGLNNPIGWQDPPEPVPVSGLGPLNRIKFGPFAPVAVPVPPHDAGAEFAQAVSVATGHILHYRAQFKADGYSLGDLVYSLPLAPGQKKEIVVLDASQTLVGAESQQLSQDERLAMGLVDERVITSRLAGSLAESLRGSSRADTSGISAGFGTAGQGYGGTGTYGGSGSAVIGIAGGSAQSSSEAAHDGSRDVAQFFSEKLRQSILQNAEGYRQLNASIVTTVQQGERFGVTSEVVANHNHCHSLTMMYFEVLRHYAIFQELVSVEECVFVPLLLARFSVENVSGWRDVLAPTLLPMPSETYLQPDAGAVGSGRLHPLARGFDAIQRIRTHYANVDFPAGSYDQETIRFLSGSLRLRVNLPRPRTRYDRVKSLPVILKTVTTDDVDVAATVKNAWTEPLLAGLTLGLSTLFTPPGPDIEYKTAQVEGKKAVFDAFMSLDANFEHVPPAECIRVTNFNPGSITANGRTVQVSGLDFFQDGFKDRQQWELYARLLGYGEKPEDTLRMLTYYFGGRLISEWDEIFNNDIAPLVFDRIVNALRLTEFATDVTAVQRYTGGERVIDVNLSGTTSRRRDQLPPQLRLTVADTRAQALRSYVTLNVEDVRLDYSTAHYRGSLYRGSLGDDLLDVDGVDLDIPERPDEKRNPRREDRYLAGALLDHLNNNLEHYNKVLWNRLDPDRRYMLLDGFSIQVYAADGTPVPGPAGFRSLASVVKNEVIAVAGNSLVLPVAPGYRVSGSFVQATSEGGTEPVTLFDHYKPLTPVEPYRVSVPSNGLFAEAVQGACNACEKIETDRAQDWTRFGTDEPTAIAPVTVPTPSLEDWRAAFREFAAPIVNVQNAPGTPTPGAGLAGLSELLSQSGVFRDITGLDANQQNVIRTYLSNQENAKAFAEMAKEMAMQSHNTQNSGKIMESISAAENAGTISQDEAKVLVKDHLQQQIDGGAGKRIQAEAASQAAATPLSQAAVTAASQGKDVTASRLDSSGNSESVTIRGTASSKVLAEATKVPHLRQTRRNDCWAVSAAMLIGWREQGSISVEDAVGAAGEKYRQIYTDDTGLYTEDKDDFVLHSQMFAEPAASYRLEQYVDWLKKYGPLWVTRDAGPGQLFSPHAWVLIRISGTGTPDGIGTDFTLIDPKKGTEETLTFTEFVRGFEDMAREEEEGQALRPQVVRFLEPIAKPEGYAIEGPFNFSEPVHETVTLAALLDSTVPVPSRPRPGPNQAVNEFLRGVLWNDDPALLLFHEHRTNNWKFTTGYAWTSAFNRAAKATANDVTNLTGRSHYFDLQFLHAMAETAGERPEDTLTKIMLWAEVMYRLSIGEGVGGSDRLDAVPIASHLTADDGTEYSARLADFFTAASLPSGSDTLRTLLTRNTACESLDLPRRAIGSLLHLVQDSYARGHVRRVLLNPGDLLPGKTDEFTSGTYGRFGDVENFHCYRGQNHKLHEKYDRPIATLSAVDPSSFNSLLGARDAIKASTSLLNMWHAATPWAAANGPKHLLEGTVFKLAATATPSDTTI